MAQLCLRCQKLEADHGGVCNICRRHVLKDASAPTLHPGIWKLAVILVGIITVTSSLIAAAVVMHRTLPWRHGANPVTYQVAMVVEQVTRKVYPYSIVPGGAENLDDAKRAMNDPAVKANFAGFDFPKLRQVKLAKNLSGYVSYRWDERIYWTSKMLTLRIGETVFTDGVRLVRGRCVNSYSPVPMLPVGPNEPTEQVLDTPVEIPVISYSFPKLPAEALEIPPPPESLTPSVPIFPQTDGGSWFPLIPIIPPIHRHPGSPPSSGGQ
jgi:hypothetical protein